MPNPVMHLGGRRHAADLGAVLTQRVLGEEDTASPLPAPAVERAGVVVLAVLALVGTGVLRAAPTCLGTGGHAHTTAGH